MMRKIIKYFTPVGVDEKDFASTRRSAEEIRGGFNLPLYLRYLQVINNKSND
jgi:hypothetical protein